MVEATSTPEYEPPFDATRIILKKMHELENEDIRDYYKREGLVRWCVNERACTAYPFRTFADRLCGRHKEYRNHPETPQKYISRIIRQGIPRKCKDNHIYIISGMMGLDLKISQMYQEEIRMDAMMLPLTTLSLEYDGCVERAGVLLGEVCRKPDFVQFSETILDLEFIAKLAGKD